MSDTADQDTLELRRLRLEERRYLADILKWAIVAVGAVVSFYVIDVGKLRLEEFRSRAENQRLLLKEYLTATEATQPDVWKRKLHILAKYSDDERIRSWAKSQFDYVQGYAEKYTLYREALKVSSQLVRRISSKDAQREAARARFEQLYWADLPFAGEDRPVAEKMVDFRNALMAAENSPGDEGNWNSLEIALKHLADTLKQSMPKEPEI